MDSSSRLVLRAHGRYGSARWERDGQDTEATRVAGGIGATWMTPALILSGRVSFTSGALHGKQREYNRLQDSILFPGEGAAETDFAVSVKHGVEFELFAGFRVQLSAALALLPFGDAEAAIALPGAGDLSTRTLGAGGGLGLDLAPVAFVRAFVGVRVGYRTMTISVPDADAVSLSPSRLPIGLRATIELFARDKKGFHLSIEAHAIDETVIVLEPGWSF